MECIPTAHQRNTKTLTLVDTYELPLPGQKSDLEAFGFLLEILSYTIMFLSSCLTQNPDLNLYQQERVEPVTTPPWNKSSPGSITPSNLGKVLNSSEAQFPHLEFGDHTALPL